MPTISIAGVDVPQNEEVRYCVAQAGGCGLRHHFISTRKAVIALQIAARSIGKIGGDDPT